MAPFIPLIAKPSSFLLIKKSCPKLKNGPCELVPGCCKPIEKMWERKLGQGTSGSQNEGTTYPQDASCPRCHGNQWVIAKGDVYLVKCIVTPAGDSPWLLLMLPEVGLISLV